MISNFLTEYRIEEDGDITLLRASEKYLHFKGYNHDVLGKNIRDFTRPRDIRGIEYYVKKSAEFGDYYDMIQVLSGANSSSLWKICVKSDYPYVQFSGEELQEIQAPESQYHRSRSLANAMPMLTAVNIVLVDKCKDKDDYIIQMYSDSLKAICPFLENGISTREMSERADCMYNTTNLLNVCVEENRMIHYYDSYIMPNGEIKMFYMCLRPLVHDNEISAMICLSLIDDEMIDTMRNFTDSSVISRFFIGFGAIDCSNLDNPYFFEVSPMLSHLVQNDSISLESILECKVLKQVLLTRASCMGKFIYQNQQGVDIPYVLDIVPSVQRGVIKSIMLTLLPCNHTTNLDKRIMEKLTNREAEIAGMVLNGYANKYIAYTLNIKEGTVKKLLYNCYQKLGVSSRVELINKLYKR